MNQQQRSLQFDGKKFSENILKAYIKYQQAIGNSIKDYSKELNEVDYDPFNLSKVIAKVTAKFASDPNALLEKNIELTKNYLLLYNNILQKILGYQSDALFKPEDKDNRFKDESWEKQPIFNFIKQAYYLNSCWIRDLAKNTKDLDKKDTHKLEFHSKLLIDAIAPTNFAFSNPEVIKQTLTTNGDNILKGAEHFARDLKNFKGFLRISTTDFNSYAVGKNLAITEGKVIFQNDLIQLIQYQPLTKSVYKTPVLIMSAWINKYYILDLQKNNSFVRWMVEKGYTVFMISWVNPDKSHSKKLFEDYMQEGALAAIEKVKEVTKVSEINMIGYCLGGTLLAISLAYLKAKQVKSFPIKTATFLTSLIDFTEVGDIGVFIDEKQILMLERRMSEKGYLDGYEMAQTFSLIRANDMIWAFYINNYLMGKTPFPFDILYWNADSTRLPAQMHSFYLRSMYKDNLLIQPNKLMILGQNIDLRSIDIPTYILSAKDDHIAPWKSTYEATQVYKGKNKFVLSGSGHVAGVVNHPSRNKYSYFTNNETPSSPQAWLDKAQEKPGSWWDDWDAWVSKQSGEKVDARKIDKAIEEAPGSYVKKRI